MLEQDVTTGNGVVKHVVAQNQEELDEAVKAVKAEKSAVAPDIHDPKDGNKIVSPDNKHTEDIPSVVDNSVVVDEPQTEAEDKADDEGTKVPVRRSSKSDKK